MILRSLISRNITNPGQFRIWTFRVQNVSPTLFCNCLAHLTVWCSSYSPARRFLLSGFDACTCLFIRTLPHPTSDWQSLRHTETDFDWICPFWLDAAWLTQLLDQDQEDPDILLSSHIENSSWIVTVSYISMFLPNFSPRLPTCSQSVKTPTSWFVAASTSWFVAASYLRDHGSIH